ncbi:hypothetical protein CC117_19200 [Parafrankia colletiae]|uniref:Phosphoribosyltransferase domain-containing protein n=1 Tax=Parafrankia colletiae TaxID=573497 RepID=A0A1S1QM09_9ACTN|nr:erythromycin esterase family protein [Parafrankia colletiae]MCK9902848.1 erythromycin esterase family protein [Frankia sp. Cpl3]OHV35773.1 hypothetical protein CC117_19200 [Parafrankia colletiae]
MSTMSPGHDTTGGQVFRDRREAGRFLAGLLERYRCDPAVLVMGVAPGGLTVAFDVARELCAPLNPLVVRKLMVGQLPTTPPRGAAGLALGAVAGGGTVVLNDDVVRGLRLAPELIERLVEIEHRELRRQEEELRSGLPPAEPAGRTVILVDDGLSTGVALHAAVLSLRRARTGRIVVAVPAAPASSCQLLDALADGVVCATTPSPCSAVGPSSWGGVASRDTGVRDLLRAASATRLPAGSGVFRTDPAIVRAEAVAAGGGIPPDDALFALVGDADVVLLGAAAHGTFEFHAARAAMTRRLIEERGFTAVAVPADWADASQVNRFVRGLGARADGPSESRVTADVAVATAGTHAAGGTDVNAEDALRAFAHFPDWMMRNRVMADFVAWLRERNDRFGGYEPAKAGFYGLWTDEGTADADPRHPIFGGSTTRWNAGERRMADDLDDLMARLAHHRSAPAKIVVWAHSSHVGDAAATELAALGRVSLGQIVRARYPGRCRLVGLTTYAGAVTTAENRGSPATSTELSPALPGSLEEIFHEVGETDFLIAPHGRSWAAEALASARLQRAVGILHCADRDPRDGYFRARAADQFDAMIHIDRTHPLRPLDEPTAPDAPDAPAREPSHPARAGGPTR